MHLVLVESEVCCPSFVVRECMPWPISWSLEQAPSVFEAGTNRYKYWIASICVHEKVRVVFWGPDQLLRTDLLNSSNSNRANLELMS
jgi:hypothetical protein